jgi:hypothetical protein
MERLPTVDRMVRRATRLGVVSAVVVFWYVVAVIRDAPGDPAGADLAPAVAVVATLALLAGGGWPRHRH